ncbi:unnamed protein product [Lactuca saligna]|uniref:DUF1421 domain-containing protein n=1 Tax=Lactuca saligna TaxID=75948 RepID=A0AA36EJR3_LACSI|nr:unnamed protein product [Lactuca saligna]
MASGSSKGFDFASDDILCSYEDYANQEGSNGNHSDSAIVTNPAKEFHKSRMARTSVFPGSSYSPPDDSGNQEVLISAVERSMKKHTDNLMRFLEGLSSRLSQLELYCYNLDKSIGEMRSDLTRDHGEADVKLKFLEKHLQEVHRSVQILRDKQELADTQKELAKLQLAHKESSSSHNSQQNEERSSTPDTKKTENSPDPHSQQLALALPSQVQPGSVPGSGSRPSSPQVYPQYHNAGPVEPLPQSMPYSGGPPLGSSQAMTYAYGGPVQTPPQPPQPQQPPQHLKPAFGGPPGDGYAAGGPPPPGYMMYDGEPGRVPHPQQQHSNQIGHFPQPGYSQNPQQVMRPTQRFTPNHPYNEVVEKLVSMGYRGDHVMSVIQRLDETGQTVDFNVVLDRLNGHSSGGSRGWSG